MSIQEHLNKIRNAVYGREVRESIAKGIETAYDDASENGNANMEVRLARGTNPNLNTRLNKMDETDRQNAGKIDSNYNEVTAQLAQKVGGGKLASLDDVDGNFIKAIEGGEGTSFNLLSVPKLKSVTPQKTTFIEQSTNLFNIDDVTLGKVINTEGLIVENASYAYSHPIEVTPGSQLTTYGVYFLAFYDVNDKFISRLGQGNSDVYTFTVPENSYIVRANVVTVSLPYSKKEIQVNVGSALLPFEPYYLKMSRDISVNIPPITNDDLPLIDASKFEFMDASTNLFNIDDITLGKVIDTTGTIVNNANYLYSHPIAVTPSTQLSTSGVYFIAFYDSNNSFITRLEIVGIEKATMTVPNNAYVAIVMTRTTSVYYTRKTIQVNKGNRLLPFEEFGAKIKTQYIPKSKGNGKNFIIDSSLQGTFDSVKQFDDFTTNGWATISSNDVYAMVDEIQTTYPEYITKQPLTPDLTGLEIAAYHLTPQRPQMTTKKPYPTIYIVTGTHGYERSSVINVYHLVKELCESWKNSELLEALRFNVNIIWIPIVNPYGWTQVGGAPYQRKNSNGVDIARQFPDDWVEDDPESSIYGGEAPLTEIEALNVKQIFDENPQIDVFYDYHNFGDVVDDYMWLATASSHAEQLGESLIKKMSRKWGSEFTFIPEGKLVGYTSIMNQGTMHNYAYKSLGIERSGTFETNNLFHLDPNGVKYNQDSLKAGLESIVNFLLINLRDLVE